MSEKNIGVKKNGIMKQETFNKLKVKWLKRRVSELEKQHEKMERRLNKLEKRTGTTQTIINNGPDYKDKIEGIGNCIWVIQDKCEQFEEKLCNNDNFIERTFKKLMCDHRSLKQNESCTVCKHFDGPKEEEEEEEEEDEEEDSDSE